MTELLDHLDLVFTLLLPAKDIVVGLSLLESLQHRLVVYHYSVEFLVAYSLVQGVVVVGTSIENRIRCHVLSLSRREEVTI